MEISLISFLYTISLILIGSLKIKDGFFWEDSMISSKVSKKMTKEDLLINPIEAGKINSIYRETGIDTIQAYENIYQKIKKNKINYVILFGPTAVVLFSSIKYENFILFFLFLMHFIISLVSTKVIHDYYKNRMSGIPKEQSLELVIGKEDLNKISSKKTDPFIEIWVIPIILGIAFEIFLFFSAKI